MEGIELNTPVLKQDILKLIAQYLQDEGFTATKTVLEDEAGIKLHEHSALHAQFKRLKSSVLDGKWEEVLTTCKQFFNTTSVRRLRWVFVQTCFMLAVLNPLTSTHNIHENIAVCCAQAQITNTPHQSFVYAVHKQCYLEYLERREIQHGFTYLTKRIKPFEVYTYIYIYMYTRF